MRFYSSRIEYWLEKRDGGNARSTPRGSRCPRYLAHVLRSNAHAARRGFIIWRSLHYDWETWLPDKWQRVGACETGYGRRPGRWDWDSGLYVSFAGIIRSGYATFAHRLGLRSWDETRRELGRYPTPREQWLVADAIQQAYGFGAWGCGGA